MNTSVNLAPLFSLGDASHWPSLSRGQAIPPALASSPQPVVGLGLVKALWALLCHVQEIACEAAGGQPPRWQIWMTSASSQVVHALAGDDQSWYAKFPGYLVGVCGALDALCACASTHPGTGPAEAAAFAQRWQALLGSLAVVLQGHPPYTEAELRVAAADTAATEAMMAASDALYAAMLARTSQVSVHEAEAAWRLTADAAAVAWLYQQAILAPSAPQPVAVSAGVVTTLRRAILRGRTALLVGPTGSGKTEAVKAAALATGATLVKIEGHPGLDDKLLFGGVYPDGHGGYAYVEGPLSEAWRYAAEGQRVVLQIDELARMDSLYHALLIGALDTLSGAEIAARPRLAEAARSLPVPLEPAGRYRVLTLPNGAILLAPEARLSVMATSNLGSAYQQAAAQLDPALVRRFALRLEVERLEEAVRVEILERAGLPASVARALVALEEFSVANTASQGGLLAEALNLGVLLDWGKEAHALVDEGASWAHALVDAAEYTCIPFVCPRLGDGRLEPPAVNVLRSEITNAARLV